jgi:hypothetical protein
MQTPKMRQGNTSTIEVKYVLTHRKMKAVVDGEQSEDVVQ